MACVLPLAVAIFALAAPHAAAARQPSGQPPEPRADLQREVGRKLESSDLRMLAWGAYEAGADRLTEAVPVLQRILESPPPPNERQRWALVDVVLDTLIQLKARLPASLLARYADERPVQSLVLLADATDRRPVLLGLLGRTSGFQWYAAANILANDRSPELAAHLLETLRLRLTIAIWDLDEVFHGGGSGVGAAGVGHGIGQAPEGYPPHAEYRFESTARPGVIVLAAGPHPVFYSRTVSTSFQYAVVSPMVGGPSDDDRLAYIKAMIGLGQQSDLRAETPASIRWSDREALIRRVQELRGDLEGRYRDLESRLLAAYGLDAPATQPHIDIRLVDRRRDRSVPLPIITR